MKGAANPKAWNNFETYALHAAPKGANNSGAKEHNGILDVKGDLYKGFVDAK